MNKFILPGPGVLCSLHNHSDWSDGGSTMREMCVAAKEAGVDIFGLSDHYVIHPAPELMPVDWSLDPEKLGDYIAELQKLKQELEDEKFSIRIGLEVDFFFENYHQILAELEKYPLDYLIGSVHYSGVFPIDGSVADWDGLSEKDMDDICTVYWQKLLGAAGCSKFLFLGHLDLPKKFGLLKEPEKYFEHACKVLDAACANGIGIELNTSGWYKQCAEQYPSDALLKEALRRGIPVVINPDAHSAKHVTRDFLRAGELLDRINAAK